jgi:hypothetical protein
MQPASIQGLFLYDWTAGVYATVDSSSFDASVGGDGEWRPGHDEIWLYAYTDPPRFAIWKPGASYLVQEGDLAQVYQSLDGRMSMFTRDGRHWFSYEHVMVGNLAMALLYVGSADDVTAPRMLLHPQGTVVSALWETSDGRLLVGASTLDYKRQDIYLVDADARTSRAIASGGHLVAIGRTRVLALLNWELSRLTGDLTLIDLATGEATVLAQDVYAVAVDPGKSADVPLDADRLAPGTRVAFLTRNRLASPYDGLWVASLP